MSEAVNVLAVIEREAKDRMASNFPRQSDELHRAHEAVAELIEAAKDNTVDCPCPGCDRVRAALVGVGATP